MCTPRQYLYDTYGTSYINVALPAVAGAKMAIEGAEKGVINPQDLDPERFLELMAQSGFKHHWEETVEEL
jgi:saccharopine dehydrogenase-like NADP-dependent oxidoreductase